MYGAGTAIPTDADYLGSAFTMAHNGIGGHDNSLFMIFMIDLIVEPSVKPSEEHSDER